MSQVAPATVVFGVVTTALAATGLIGAPIAMVAVAIALMIFIVGYVAMARHIENPGAFYAYIARGLWKPLGVGASLVALLSYVAFVCSAAGGFGFTASALLSSWTGTNIQWWWLSLVGIAAVALLGVRRIGIAGRVLAVFVIAETIVVLISAVATMMTPGFHFNAEAMQPAQLWGSNGAILFVIGVTAYVGYEAAPAYIRESRNPRRTVPRASYITLIAVAILYWFASWVQISGAGAQAVERATAQGPDLFANLATGTLGGWVVDLNRLLFSTSLFAAFVAFHNVSARYLAVLGQEGVLPRYLGRTANEAPRAASGTLTALTFVVVAVYAVAAIDPLVRLFFYGAGIGALGVLLLSAVTSVAVIGFFARDGRGESLWHRVIAPAISAVILLITSYLALTHLEALFGPDTTTVTTAVRWALLIVFVAGVVWGLILRVARPNVYAGIGQGTASRSSALASVFDEPEEVR